MAENHNISPAPSGLHTAGPWAVRLHAGSSANGASIVAGDLRVAGIQRKADRPYWQKVADAHLIAAAPDLLAALHRIAGSLDECGCTHDDENCCNVVGVFCGHCIAAEAIAKAEGKDPA